MINNEWKERFFHFLFVSVATVQMLLKSNIVTFSIDRKLNNQYLALSMFIILHL